MNPPLLALFILRVAAPAILILNAISLLFIKPPEQHAHQDESPITPVVVRVFTPRRKLITILLCLAAATYFVDALVVIIFAVVTRQWQGAQEAWRGIGLGDFLGVVAFATVAVLGTVKESQGKVVWNRRRVRLFALLACAFDITIVLLMATSIDFRKKEGGVKIPEKPDKAISLPAFSHFVLAVLRLLFSIPLLTALTFPRRSYVPVLQAPTPRAATASSSSLLHLSQADQQTGYGTFSSTPIATGPPSPANNGQYVLPKKPDPKQEISLDPTWAEMGRRLKRLTPYLWPRNSRPLQGLALLCLFVLAIGRVVNPAQPIIFGKLVALLERFDPEAPKSTPIPSPWPLLGVYVILRFLQSQGGLPALRDSLWAPVMQYSDREMSQLTFNHLLNLSLSFHTRRKTGEVLRVLDRGATINHILELILFNILPTIADMVIALVYFFIWFEWSLAVIILIVMIAYISASITLTTWRTKIRRKMNDQDVITRGIHTDCLLNYETVKYFGGEEHESARYSTAIRSYQQYEYQVMLSLNLLNLIQAMIIALGLLAGSAIVANSVVQQRKMASDFVTFIVYLAQLYGPLNNLGYIYRSINTSLVDTERLMKLLDEPTDVNDKPDAEELVVEEGEIFFDNVSFSYDGRAQALNGVTFKVPKGSKVALVGESGAGKSTILRLLYRFYDLKEGQGRILIDGRDIRDVTQSSLRKSIGVVPQDSVLFNTSISYNIGYGKFDAIHEEIEAAAKLAQMHDRIVSFPDGYETKVGERGVRLSGGEKQRVAIARTLLKNPPILLLDEATSALDTSTERDIQQALQNLMQGRSSLSIAHRLSTIASADLILVLNDGQVVEQGSHKELLAQNGIFAKMWADQVDADRRAQPPGSIRKEIAFGYSLDEASPQETALDSTPVPDTTVEAEDLLDFSTRSEPVESDAVAASALPAQVVDEGSDAPIDTPAVGELPSSVGEVAEVQSVEKAVKDSLSEPEEQAEVLSPQSHIHDTPTQNTPTQSVHEQPQTTSDTPGPISFPTKADDAASATTSTAGVATPTAGVTFSPSVDSPPRSGTPDPDSQPKRKRISSQNFQRIARRISLGTKRTSSSSSLKLDSPVTRTPQDDTGSQQGSNSSVGEKSKEKKKKEKKSKKKAGTL